MKKISSLSAKELQDSAKAQDYLQVMDEARAMMDSPVKRAFDFAKDEKPEILAAYQPKIKAEE